MILSRPDLRTAWKTGKIRFRPDISEEQIGLSSIDLRLGYDFTRLKNGHGVKVRPASEGFDPTGLVEHYNLGRRTILGKYPVFRIMPGEFRLALTLEEVALPGSLAANVQGKSSLARSGLGVHITAPHIHPGFVGPIALELFNRGPWHLEFIPGKDLVCQIIFFRITKNLSPRIISSLGTYMRQASPYPTRRTPRQRPLGRAKNHGGDAKSLRKKWR